MHLAPYLSWLVFFGAFYWRHRVVWAGADGARPEKRVRRERSSDYGMALQFVAIAVALFVAPAHADASWLPGIGLGVAAASIVFARTALLHLGRQWRVQAVIAEDHQLITSGPFRVVRHPVYLSFFGMLLATALMRGLPPFSGFAALLFLSGTEIRVRAEERLLFETFGPKFVAYRERTQWAYLPWVR